MIDHDYMRIHNMGQILETMRNTDELFTKRDLQRLTGLSWAMVSGAVEDLLARGIIIEIPVSPTHSIGRPAKKYDRSEEHTSESSH